MALLTSVFDILATGDVAIGEFSRTQLARGVVLVLLILNLALRGWNALHGFGRLWPLGLLGVYQFFVDLAFGASVGAALVVPLRVLLLYCVFATAHYLTLEGVLSKRVLNRVAWFNLAIILGSQILAFTTGTGLGAYRSDYATAGIAGRVSSIALGILATLPIFLLNPSHMSNRLAVVGCLCSAIVTYRRTALAGIGLALIIAASIGWTQAFGGFKRSRMLMTMCVGILTVWCILFYTPLGHGYFARLADINIFDGGTGSGRIALWETALHSFRQAEVSSRFMGVGRDNILRATARQIGNPLGFHSDWADITIGYGIIGGVLYVGVSGIFISILRKLSDADKTLVPASWAALGAFTLVGLVSGGTLDPSCGLMFALFGFVSGVNEKRAMDSEWLGRSI